MFQKSTYAIEHQETNLAQNGEDRILQRILVSLGINCGVFCEFGAWDGLFMANCRSLAEAGWRGVFIEGNAQRFSQLERNYANNDKVTPIHAWVARTGRNSLDNLLAQVDVVDLDVLSIDINSDDLGIWMACEHVRASIVIIEYNPTIPFDTEYVNPVGAEHGNSALSIFNYAQSVGYDLVAGTETNLVFVDSAINGNRVSTTDLDRIRADHLAQRYAFGYDGTLLCIVDQSVNPTPELFPVPWSRFKAVQPLPRSLRGLGRLHLLQLSWSVAKALFTRPYVLRDVASHAAQHFKERR